jgi:ATP-dependent protease ClpP protease subunit
MKSWYNIRANGREVQIDLMEDIGAFGVNAKAFRDDLKMVGETEPLHVHINSDGGDIIEGNEIYNALIEHKGEVRVTIGALAASIASVIAMAGDEIEIAENGMLMIHNPWTMLVGDSEELRKVAKTLDDFKAGIVKAYQRQTNLSQAEISALMSDETWFTAEEAEQLGFVDSITPGDKADTERAKNFNVGRFRNSAAFRNQLLEGNNKLKTKENLLNKNGDGGNGQPSEDDDLKAKADQLFKAERARIAEIQDIVDTVKKHDKLDFSNEARKAIADGVSAEAFSKALVKSDRFKSLEVIGSGRETFLNGEGKTLGDIIARSPELQAVKARGSLAKGQTVTIDVPRNILSFRPRGAAVTSTGLTNIEHLPGVPGYLALMEPKVADVVGRGATSGSTVRYIKETSFTSAVVTVAEGAAKPEQPFALAEVDAPVRKLACWTKMSDELIQDYERVAGFINVKVQGAVLLALDDQILNGNGAGSNLTGILQTAGVQTQAKGGDTNLDAIHKALTKVRAVSFFEPDAIVINPNDWQLIRLAKDGNGQYFAGGPIFGPYGQGGFVPQPTVWGKPAIITTAIAAGTVLVGSFLIGAELYMRQALTLDMTNSDQDDFIKNLLTLRAELRAALAVPHPLAFCQVTGVS